jgi:hypothetical protein
MNFPSLSWYESANKVENDSNNTIQPPLSFMGRLFELGLPTDDTKALDSTDTAEETDSLEVSGSSDRAVIPMADSFSTPDKPVDAKQEMTPSTGGSSDIFADTPETEIESPYSGADASGIVDSMSSFISSDSQSTAFHRDRMRFHIRRPKQDPPDFSLRATEKEALLKSRKHLSPFAYGKKLTVSAVLFALTGIVLAVLSKRSLSFVTLDNRIEISPQLNEVERIGLVQLRLCYNETSAASARQLEATNEFVRRLSTETVPTTSAGKAVSHHDQTGCFVLRLTTETIDDTMWNVSRSFLSLAIAFGSFLSVMLCLSMYWESINLKPVVLGLLLTYFFQSLSFFFFDSDLCRDNTCRLAEGSIMSILASLCWFLSGLCCIRMDVLYRAQQSKWDRRRKRAIKKLKLQRKYSEATEATTITEDDASSRVLPEGRNLAFIFDEEAQEVVDIQKWLASGEEDDVISPAQSDKYHI